MPTTGCFDRLARSKQVWNPQSCGTAPTVYAGPDHSRRDLTTKGLSPGQKRFHGQKERFHLLLEQGVANALPSWNCDSRCWPGWRPASMTSPGRKDLRIRAVEEVSGGMSRRQLLQGCRSFPIVNGLRSSGPARESAWPAERWPFPAARSCDARSWCSPAGPSGRLG